VFCSHLSDVFDTEVDDEWRVVLIERIQETPWLDWLLLTKRPKVAAEFFDDVGMPSNVWMGTTVEDQKMADLRIPILLSIPAKVRFLSCEPLLGPVDLDDTVRRARLAVSVASPVATSSIDWVISGGESGPKARPSHPDWFRIVRDQCAAGGVPFFFKQNGEWIDADQPGVDMLGTAKSAMHDWGDGRHSVRVGKKAAGAKLDGVLHREFPR
jgi:protein gp37